MNLKNVSNLNKKIILILSDTIIICFSISMAFSLRLEKIYPLWEIDYRIFIIFLAVFFLAFYFLNIYQILLRFFDHHSIIRIIKAILIFQLIAIIINFSLYEQIYFPRSISFIAPIIIGIFVITHRIILSYIINIKDKSSKIKNNILIYGINKSTVNLLKNLRQFPEYGNVKCFIDDTGFYKKREINGIKIYKNENILKILRKNFISEIIVGPKIISKKKKEDLFHKLKNKNVRIINMENVLNYMPDLIHRSFDIKIDIFDVINRPKIHVDEKTLKKKISNKNILVTGGGGSIGGELCIEILKHKPKKIYILDISEINLFSIITKIKQKKLFNKKIIKIILGDCSDKNFLKNHFEKSSIDDIYHAAAYKHVMFGEDNVYSIVKNNIIGTKIILEFAVEKNIKDFIFISSDKAVNPSSILGITKKFGELLVNQIYQKHSKNNTKFTIVRFGNVIGSSGSVIPIFLDQINKKLPLTVTNKKATRYFMSIEEAVQLVINSSFINREGIKIYALDMGEQIKIYDIAKRVISLSGKTIKDFKNPTGDIGIKITGLKEGEKISEEISLGKKIKKTSHPKIMLCDEDLDKNDLNYRLSRINKIIHSKKFNKKMIKKMISKK